jgi:multidrug efflux system outer membrane protein
MRELSILRAWRALPLALVLSGCTVGPDYVRPQLPHGGESFKYGNAPDYQEGRTDPAFWRLFGDPLLSELVEHALLNAYDIRIAQAQLRESRALRREANWQGLPALNFSASKTRSSQSEDEFFGPDPAFRKQDLYDAGFDTSWELDLWGGARRYREALRRDLDAGAARLADVQVLIAAETARNYLEMRGLQRRLTAARDNLDAQAQTLKLTRLRLDAGSGTELDVARAQAQFQGSMALIPGLEQQLQTITGTVAFLTTRDGYELGPQILAQVNPISLPQQLSIAPPAQLLRRRPDVVAAEQELAAATARIGVNVASLFPRVSLIGSFGAAADSAGDLISSGSERYRFGPSLSWGLINLGQTKARIAASEARAEGQLARYERVVYQALLESENTLNGYRRARITREATEAAAQASQDSQRLARLRFDAGVSDLFTVLDADRVKFDADDRLAQAQTAEATALVAVYKALGGGFFEYSADDSSAAVEATSVSTAPQ